MLSLQTNSCATVGRIYSSHGSVDRSGRCIATASSQRLATCQIERIDNTRKRRCLMHPLSQKKIAKIRKNLLAQDLTALHGQHRGDVIYRHDVDALWRSK